MEVRYNVTGARRKELVRIVAEITGGETVYRYAPTFAFDVDFFKITKDGTLVYPDGSDAETVEKVLEGLAKAGFEGEQDSEDAIRDDTVDSVEPAAVEDAAVECANEEAAGTAKEKESVGLTISIPLEKVNVDNLTRILEVKGGLIRKALAVDALPIEVGEDAVSFPWFDELPDADSVNTYTHLISALCQMSREQKRINATSKDVENEKYTFRCFLLRLGFIGEEYKTERKILLKNLSGSSAFRDGERRAIPQ